MNEKWIQLLNRWKYTLAGGGGYFGANSTWVYVY